MSHSEKRVTFLMKVGVSFAFPGGILALVSLFTAVVTKGGFGALGYLLGMGALGIGACIVVGALLVMVWSE